MAWSTSGNKSPEHVLQLKVADVADQEDQKGLLFLGDIAAAAMDRHLLNGSLSAHAAIVVENIASRKRLASLPTTGTVSLRLDPQTAVERDENGVSWVTGSTIHPATPGQYNKIFGAGTNGKFVGLWRRPGTVTIEASASLETVGQFTIILYSVLTVDIVNSGGLSVEHWWP